MRKSLFIILAFVATISTTSCVKLMLDLDEPATCETSPSPEDEPFIASFEANPLTKTDLSKDSQGMNYSLSWSYGDKISISDGKSLSVYRTFSNETSNATFSLYEGNALRGTGPYTAFYPSTLSDKNKVLPGVQNYVPDNVENFPMRAVSENHSLKFKNLCGIICLNVKSEASNSFKVSRIILSSPGKGMSGEFTISDDAAVVSASSEVVLSCPKAVSLYSSIATPFNVIVPKGSYNPLNVTIVDTDGNEIELASDAAVIVSRSGMTRLNITLKDSSFGSDLEVIPITDSDVDFSSR